MSPSEADKHQSWDFEDNRRKRARYSGDPLTINNYNDTDNDSTHKSLSHDYNGDWIGAHTEAANATGSPAKQPTKIKLSLKLGALRNQPQPILPPVAPISRAYGGGYGGKAGANGNNDDGDGDDDADSYYDAETDDEPVDIDDAEEYGSSRQTQKPAREPSAPAIRAPEPLKTELVSGATSGDHTPRIKLRFSFKKPPQLLNTKDHGTSGTATPATPSQPEIPAPSQNVWGNGYGTVVPGSPSEIMGLNMSSIYQQRMPNTAPISRSGQNITYSPSLASDAESDDSDAEGHTLEHIPQMPMSASTATMSGAAAATGVRRRGRPPLRGRRSSSISSWHGRGGSSVASRRLPGTPGTPGTPSTATTVSLKSSLQRLIKRIRKRDSYGFFLEPVDTSVITDYRNVIKHPMDLGTMQRKVETGTYMSIDEFRQDILLVCENTRKYNGATSIYARSADHVQGYATVAIDREAVKLERVGMASIPVRANDSDSVYESPYPRAYADRSRSNSRSRSRSRSATPTQYNSATEDQSDSHLGGEHRRSSRLRWRGGASDASGVAGNANATPASIVDIFKWSGTSKKKNKRVSTVPRKTTESQMKVSLLPDGSIDPVGFEEDVALVPFSLGDVSLPLLAGPRFQGASTANVPADDTPGSRQSVHAYGLSFAPVSLSDIGPYRGLTGTNLATATAGLDKLGTKLQPIHGDALGMAYWHSISDFIDGAGDEVAQYAATVMDHLTNGSHSVARDTLCVVANRDCASVNIGTGDAADEAPVKREGQPDIDIPGLVGWLDSKGARDQMFAQRAEALTRAIPLSELSTPKSGDEDPSATRPEWISEAQKSALFARNSADLKQLHELNQGDGNSASVAKKEKEIAANIYALSEQMCLALVGSAQPSALLPGLCRPSQAAYKPAPSALGARSLAADPAADMYGYPMSSSAATGTLGLIGKGSVALKFNRTMSTPSLPSLHSKPPLGPGGNSTFL